MQFAVSRQAFDGCYGRAVGLNGEDGARFHRLAVEHDRTCAAQRRFTADVRAGQFQNVPQVMNEEHAWLDLIAMRDTIHAQIDSLFHELPHFENFGCEELFLRRTSKPLCSESQSWFCHKEAPNAQMMNAVLCFMCLFVAQTVACELLFSALCHFKNLIEMMPQVVHVIAY